MFVECVSLGGQKYRREGQKANRAATQREKTHGGNRGQWTANRNGKKEEKESRKQAGEELGELGWGRERAGGWR